MNDGFVLYFARHLHIRILLVKQLLHTPILYGPEKKSCIGDTCGIHIKSLERINRLASGLSSLGVGPGTRWQSRLGFTGIWVFRDPMTGDTSHGEYPSVSGTDPLYNESAEDLVFSFMKISSCA
jgi:hypothetical protein